MGSCCLECLISTDQACDTSSARPQGARNPAHEGAASRQPPAAEGHGGAFLRLERPRHLHRGNAMFPSKLKVRRSHQQH